MRPIEGATTTLSVRAHGTAPPSVISAAVLHVSEGYQDASQRDDRGEDDHDAAEHERAGHEADRDTGLMPVEGASCAQSEVADEKRYFGGAAPRRRDIADSKGVAFPPALSCRLTELPVPGQRLAALDTGARSSTRT